MSPRWSLAAPAAAALFLIVVGCVTAVAVSARSTPTRVIVVEIETYGGAAFDLVDDERRERLWTVSCRAPLRDCMARKDGLVVSLDRLGNVRLSAFVHPDADVTIAGTETGAAAPLPLGDALTPTQLATLDDRGVGISIAQEESEVVIGTEGLGRVADYLTWVESDTAHALRDARLWPRDGDLDPEEMSEEVRERWRQLRRRMVEPTA